MTMFDWYEPDPGALCPDCRGPVDEWQGYGGPNALFLSVQHRRHPVDQLADADSRISPERYVEFELPEAFTITGYCKNRHRLIGSCSCSERTWTTTVVARGGTSQ